MVCVWKPLQRRSASSKLPSGKKNHSSCNLSKGCIRTCKRPPRTSVCLWWTTHSRAGLHSSRARYRLITTWRRSSSHLMGHTLTKAHSMSISIKTKTTRSVLLTIAWPHLTFSLSVNKNHPCSDLSATTNSLAAVSMKALLKSPDWSTRTDQQMARTISWSSRMILIARCNSLSKAIMPTHLIRLSRRRSPSKLTSYIVTTRCAKARKTKMEQHSQVWSLRPMSKVTCQWMLLLGRLLRVRNSKTRSCNTKSRLNRCESLSKT